MTVLFPVSALSRFRGLQSRTEPPHPQVSAQAASPLATNVEGASDHLALQPRSSDLPQVLQGFIQRTYETLTEEDGISVQRMVRQHPLFDALQYDEVASLDAPQTAIVEKQAFRAGISTMYAFLARYLKLEPIETLDIAYPFSFQAISTLNHPPLSPEEAATFTRALSKSWHHYAYEPVGGTKLHSIVEDVRNNIGPHLSVKRAFLSGVLAAFYSHLIPPASRGLTGALIQFLPERPSHLLLPHHTLAPHITRLSPEKLTFLSDGSAYGLDLLSQSELQRAYNPLDRLMIRLNRLDSQQCQMLYVLRNIQRAINQFPIEAELVSVDKPLDDPARGIHDTVYQIKIGKKHYLYHLEKEFQYQFTSITQKLSLPEGGYGLTLSKRAELGLHHGEWVIGDKYKFEMSLDYSGGGLSSTNIYLLYLTKGVMRDLSQKIKATVTAQEASRHF